jgi:hypothetical protein
MTRVFARLATSGKPILLRLDYGDGPDAWLGRVELSWPARCGGGVLNMCRRGCDHFVVSGITAASVPPAENLREQ